MIDRTSGTRPWMRLVCALLTGTMLAGCATQSPEASYVVAQPEQTPVRTTTDFTQSLRCMDDMFLRRRFNYGIPISSIGVPDKTGKIFAGTRDMLIGAISAMSTRSNAFKYIDDDLTLEEVFGGPRPLSSGLYVRGSVSQLDQGVINDNAGGGITVAPVAGIGVNKQLMTSTMGVDMSLGDIVTRTILPGTAVSNTLAISLRSKGADLDARVSSVGLDYSVNISEQEGTHAALRALIELSTIEMLGRYAKVPYWQCLGMAGTDPRARKAAFDQYSSMRDDQRAVFVASALKGAGYYNGPAVTALTPDLRAAAARYEQDNNQPAVGLVTFELYYGLVSATGGPIAPPQQVVAASEMPAPPVPAERAKAPFITLSRESSGAQSAYRGESVRFTADLAQDGYLTCFYQDGDSKVFRAYPNPTQPSEFVGAGRKILVPGAGDYFRITPTTVGSTEFFACFSSSHSILGALPEELSEPALKPLPVVSIDALAQQIVKAMGRNLYAASNGYLVVQGPK